MTGQTISHYRITERLGEGVGAWSSRAEDTKLERTVALKFLAAYLLDGEEAKARFYAKPKRHPLWSARIDVARSPSRQYSLP